MRRTISRVGFIAPTWRVRRERRRFYNKRGTCEQYIKEARARSMDAAVMPVFAPTGAPSASCARLQPRNFLRTLATPERSRNVADDAQGKVIKIGAKSSVTPLCRFQMGRCECHASMKRRERCVSMTGNSTFFNARRAFAAQLHSLGIPTLRTSGNVSRGKIG